MWKWIIFVNIPLFGLDYLYVKLAVVGWTEKMNEQELSGRSFLALALCYHLAASLIFYGLGLLSRLYDMKRS